MLRNREILSVMRASIAIAVAGLVDPALSLDRPMIFGRVASISEGGMIVGIKGGKPELHMSRVVVASNHTIEVDPREIGIVGSVLALREDHPIQPLIALEEDHKVKTDAPN